MRRLLVSGALLAAFCLSASAQYKKKPEEEKFRMVQGIVTDSKDNAVDGAVVQLKNSKTLQVRSFITREHGSYYFHGLDPNVDYLLKAEFQESASDAKTLSSFDSRKQPVINLKLDKKKE